MCKNTTTGGFLASALRYGTRAFLSVMAIMLLTSALFAQNTTGSISGTVADKDGAVVPNAKITLTNLQTKDTRETKSNNDGIFVFPALPPSTYGIKVEATGFKAWVIKGIVIEAGDKKSVPSIALQVGSAGDTVTVESSALSIQIVDSGDRSATLTNKQINSLALVGRDVTELVKTLPGFNVATGSANGLSLSNTSSYDPKVTSIGGAVGNGYTGNGAPYRNGGTSITSDGAQVIDPGCNCNSTQSVNADMVSEVKVSTSSFSADSALGPVVIQAIGKSGSSQYHGMAYFNFRNGTMNSNDYQSKASNLGRTSQHYDYPGVQVGGPIKIPGTSFNKDNKLLFFFAYEYYHQKYLSTVLKAMVPTDSMRAGNVDPTASDNAVYCNAVLGKATSTSDGICNPTYNLSSSGTGIETDGILASTPVTLAAGAKAFMTLIPTANFTPTSSKQYNYAKSIPTSDIGWMLRGRVDYSFNESNKISGTYNQQKDTSLVPVMLWWAATNSIPYPGGLQTQSKSRTLSVNFTSVISSSVTNEAVFSWGFLNAPYINKSSAVLDKTALNFPFTGIQDLSSSVPSFMDSAWSTKFAIPSIYQGDIGEGANSYFAKKSLPTVTDNITKLFGKHTLKTGFFWTRVQNKQLNFSQGSEPNGFLNYGWATNNDPSYVGAAATGDYQSNEAMVNFLTDYAQSYSETTSVTDDMAYTSVAGFLQDDWKATNNLTFNLGIRLSHEPNWYDHTGTNGLATWTAANYATDISRGVTALPGMRWHGNDSSVPLGGRKTTPIFISPRFGMAWNLFGNGTTVLRGGWGMYYYHDQYNSYAGALGEAMGTTTCTLNQGFLSWYQNNALAPGSTGTNGAWKSGQSCASSLNLSSNALQNAYAVDPNDHSQPVTYTYNLQLDRQLPFNNMLEVAYSGSQSAHQLNAWENINAIPLKAFFGNDPISGNSFAKNQAALNNDNYVEDTYGNWNEIKYDYVPYKHYKTLDVVRHNTWDNYNALQISLNRNRGALTYALNYTWSKMLGVDNASTDGNPDPFNMHNNYGVLPTDRSHVFNATATYEIGNHFRSNKYLDEALDGWAISNITVIQSGPNMQSAYGAGRNFGISATTDSADTASSSTAGNMNNINVLGSTSYTLMPTITCNPTTNLAKNQYFNINCFGTPTVGSGNNGTYAWPYIHGPAYWNSDVTLAKTFKITERQNIQFKIAAFNFLNHPLPSFDSNNTSTSLGFTETYSNGVRTYAPSAGTAAYKNFGYTTTKFGQRTLELMLKYNF